MKKITFLLFIITISTQLMVAQNLDRANNLFKTRAYLDAAELFLNEEPKTQEILEKLGDCYYFNNEMNQAELWYKTLLESYEANVDSNYLFRYSQTLKGVKKFKEADKWFQKYQEKEQLKPAEKPETLTFFEALNKDTKKPYVVTKVSINSKFSDFGPAFFGEKVIFASARNNGKLYDWNNQPYLDLYQADVNNVDLTNAIPFSKTINTKMHESNAAFTKDGTTMYFTGNNITGQKIGRDKNKVNQLSIYKAQFVNNEWTNITDLPFNSDQYSVEHAALSPDEKQLYFASDMPGTIGSFDIFVVDINADGTYGSPKNLGPKINTSQREQFPFVSSKNILYFASDGHFGMGGLDIFKSEISNDTFSTPKNLSDVINSNLDDFGFIVDEENGIGYFSSNREGGMGDDDIYRFTLEKTYYLNGFVKNKNSLELLPGTLVTLFDDKNNAINEMIIGDDAAYSFEIEKNKNYKIRGTKKLFNPSEIEFSTNQKGDVDKDIFLSLESYEDSEKAIVVENEKTQIKINPIYFDYDKWDIRPDAAIELNNVVDIMKKYPDMTIEIGAHTDVRGSDEYNMILSHKRAKSVMEYLISQGISKDNLKSEGFGETQPLNHCVKEGICKEEEYAINRRCEFVLSN
ncbi:OmpA family protein [Lutibacter sp.]|uniref:OmpA family protein n=1 Tax=Lutibacter sp. TaxID=1925666 RepID=UPI00356A0B02